MFMLPMGMIAGGYMPEGKFTVTVKLHSEVTAEINLEVVGY